MNLPRRQVAGCVLRAAMTAAIMSAGLIAPTPAAQPTSAEDAHAIGVQAYLYFYPLVTMDLTRRQLTNVEHPQGIDTPMNSFANLPAFPSADMKVVVRPNFDTLYSSSWLDLTREPMIVSAPNTNGKLNVVLAENVFIDDLLGDGVILLQMT